MTEDKLRCFLAILLSLFLLTSSAEGGAKFKTDIVEIAASDNGQSIHEWRVRTNAETNDWMSLVTCDDHGKVLSHHLEIEGIDFSGRAQHQFSNDHGWSTRVFSKNGEIELERIIIPTDADYRLKCRMTVTNLSDKTITLPEKLKLILGPGLGEYPANKFGIAEKLYSFVEPLVSIDGEIRPLTPEEDLHIPDNSRRDSQSIWYGLNSRYFALLLKNVNGLSPYSISSRPAVTSTTERLPGRYLPDVVINYNIDKLSPGQKVRTEFLIFSGPKSIEALTEGEFNFKQILFYNLWKGMQALCLGLLWLLSKIHFYFKNWGISILILAVLVRICMYPLASKVLSSQKKYIEVQKIIQPKIADIKKEYRGGEQSERILMLYKEYKVSPLAGLKPLLIVILQIPIFIALFHVLGSAFELRSASFLWIKSLAEPDQISSMPFNLPFFGSYINLLPLLLALSTLMTIKMSPAPTVDEKIFSVQNLFLVAMALGFFILFYSFPSGMILYWIAANVLHILQHKIAGINRKRSQIPV